MTSKDPQFGEPAVQCSVTMSGCTDGNLTATLRRTHLAATICPDQTAVTAVFQHQRTETLSGISYVLLSRPEEASLSLRTASSGFPLLLYSTNSGMAPVTMY